MPLWKPYADDAEVPLDLTKNAAQVPQTQPQPQPQSQPQPQPQPQPQLPVPKNYPRYSGSDDPEFEGFSRMAERNDGALLGAQGNPRMRRAVRSSRAPDAADDAYRRQRERNNLAARQSRERRKMREIHAALQLTSLKKELAALKAALGTKVCGRCQ